MRRAAILIVLLTLCVFRLKAQATGLACCGVRLQAEHAGRLRVSGTSFVTADGRPFDWRGITAFRLVEMVAHGRDRDADAYLAWAASKKLTLVRVLTMADVLFKLSPADGQHALPRLLDMAQKHGLYVEVVVLADTAPLTVDIPRYVKAIGEICGRYPNALVEIANEPGHPTQAKATRDVAFRESLLSLVPAGVPVALGSTDGDASSKAAYVTWHAPRSGDWPAQIARGAALVTKFKKPVVNDEPIGAADTAVAGRRDNDPARFRAAAVASRKAGLGATFHYEGGLHAKLPTPKELACLDAWLDGLSAGK